MSYARGATRGAETPKRTLFKRLNAENDVEDADTSAVGDASYEKGLDSF